MIQKTLDGKETIHKEFEEVFADENIDTGEFDVYRAHQQLKAQQFFKQHEKHPLDAKGYVRLLGPCGSTHLQPVKPNCIRYFECWRCKRKVDRREEPMMQFSGENQTFGLQRPFHSYCWDCYWIVKRASKGRLGGLTGREFACVATELINDRRNPGRGFSIEIGNDPFLTTDEMPLLKHINLSREELTKRANELYEKIKEWKEKRQRI